ncbi:MAG TPA: 5-amino-6-(D-ribitylamino)uracil--L-tyrosine 4-hydroxyphenyl transferase CofH [Gaiellaceae bacterium]|nr:5-amino-6-(D-ribitylamino)uracil--L-tyrosine 4-hydroxyphenyl transferase CofH [Gaiellaceae bacterium]
MPDWRDALAAAAAGERLGATAAATIVDAPTPLLCEAAQGLRRSSVVTYSPKVFIPLTHLCRDVCHYCTFARPPRRSERAYMTEQEVLAVARAGAEAGCNEALFTLGDKPELRYRAAREELAALGCETTLEYLERCARLVLEETGLLPHVNAGVMGLEDVVALRAVSVSQGLMLEGSAPALAARGGPHFGSPDKRPEARLATIAAAGEARVPFTSGILIGIGETRAERLDALLAIRDQHDRYGHLQEVIVQNFRAKPGTKMAGHSEPELDEVLWSAAAARLVLGSDMHIQVPPNLSEDFGRLLEAGIDDWGGISPVTIDHVNPEAPWPAVAALERVTEAAGLELAPRLPVYPEFVREAGRWLDHGVVAATLRRSDALGLGREDSWSAGAAVPVPARTTSSLIAAVDRVERGGDLREADLVALLTARGRAAAAVCAAADDLRRQVHGDDVTYVVTRNVNYTNVCYFRCGFCAFSKGKLAASLRGKPYLVPHAEVARRAREAWERGATEVCLQGGIHPAFTGRHYLEVCRAVKDAVPDIHVHAFSALEIWQGASTLRLPLDRYLAELREAGLSSLPGTAAEILDDEVRRELCPDKVTTDQWLHVHETAHRAGLRSTATIMFGHIDRPWHVARHLLRVRDLQRRTRGFTELVPLPFVHMEAPVYLKGKARPGPTFREAILLHAVARLALHPEIPNIQASWVKLGLDGAQVALQAGCNDLGGTLMNESISRAAGASHGEEVPPERMDETIRALGRTPRRRTTLYGEPPAEQVARSYDAPPLSPPVNPPVKDANLVAPPRLVRPGFVGAGR